MATQPKRLIKRSARTAAKAEGRKQAKELVRGGGVRRKARKAGRTVGRTIAKEAPKAGLSAGQAASAAEKATKSAVKFTAGSEKSYRAKDSRLKTKKQRKSATKAARRRVKEIAESQAKTALKRLKDSTPMRNAAIDKLTGG